MFIGQENGGDRKVTGSRLPVHGTVEIEVWDLALVKPRVRPSQHTDSGLAHSQALALFDSVVFTSHD